LRGRLANNVNYGGAAILGSLARLDRLGIAIPALEKISRRRARRPSSSAAGEAGLRAAQLGLLADQSRGGEKSTGIAALRAHTAYQVPAHKTRPEIPPMNRRASRRSS